MGILLSDFGHFSHPICQKKYGLNPSVLQNKICHARTRAANLVLFIDRRTSNCLLFACAFRAAYRVLYRKNSDLARETEIFQGDIIYY